MKITIDETTFNEAIANGHMEVAKWLMDKGCPVNPSCYILAKDIKTLNWINDAGVLLNKDCLADVVNTTSDKSIVSWFLKHGAEINSDAIDACILRGKKELFEMFTGSAKVILTVENFKAGVLSENYDILDYLKSKKCPYDESVAETAMKHKKKISIRWLVLNDYI
jgi:hypothetical protein